MGPLLFTVEGMLHGPRSLTVGHLLDHLALDGAGRLVVAMVDLLAVVRIDTGADLLLVHGCDGSSRAIRLRDVATGDVFLRLQVSEGPGSDEASWIARLGSPDDGSSSPVASIHAMSFAAFVGAP
jgi:hypothetical protein